MFLTFLFFFLKQINSKITTGAGCVYHAVTPDKDYNFYLSNQTCSVKISPGRYTFQVWGAQGGQALNGKKPDGIGGYGAYAKGELLITGDQSQFYVVVGGQGGNAEVNSGAVGGYNGGGRGGNDKGWVSGAGDDGGGGGGASDVRVYSTTYYYRIIVAAGGSGGARHMTGAGGGALYGFAFYKDESYSQTSQVSQTDGNVDGVGTTGKEAFYVPGSGGGGGFRGGYGGEASDSFGFYKSVGSSGSSYINGYSSCPPFTPVPMNKFENMVMSSGYSSLYLKKGHGEVRIQTIYECTSFCHTCTGPNSGQCTKCSIGYLYYKGDCYSTCPSSTYPDSTKKYCYDCSDRNCQKCSSGGTYDCSMCNNGFLLQANNTCADHCDDGYYSSVHSNSVIINGIGNADIKNNVNNDAADNDGNNGAYKYIKDDVSKCLACHTSCRTCSESLETNCLSCKDGNKLYIGKCFNNCPSGSYSVDKGNCATCNSACMTCDGPRSEDCLSCKEGEKFYEKKCYSTCPDGSYQSSDTMCATCNPNCLTCNGSLSTHCLSCKTGYEFREGVCYTKCNPGEYQFDKDNCFPCYETCSTCNGPSDHECTSCANDTYFYMNQCYSERCPDGSFQYNKIGDLIPNHNPNLNSKLYYNPNSNENLYENLNGDLKANLNELVLSKWCLPCDANCLTCKGETSNDCLSCKGDYKLYNMTCIDNCPIGSYEIEGRLCEKCNESCASCNGPNDSDCLSCPSGFMLFKGHCFSEICPKGTYPFDASTCLECDKSCKVCDGPFSTMHCSECNAGFFYFNKGCYPGRCPDGTYLNNTNDDNNDIINNINNNNIINVNNKIKADIDGDDTNDNVNANNSCELCDPACKTCDGPTAANCTSCELSFKLFEKVCYDTICPDGSYEVNQSSCGPCYDRCETCLGPNNTQCMTCKAGFKLYQNMCYDQCPNTTFETKNEVCLECDDNCSTCNGPSEYHCLSCFEGYKIYEHGCTLECPKGSYQSDNLTCTRCHGEFCKTQPFTAVINRFYEKKNLLVKAGLFWLFINA